MQERYSTARTEGESRSLSSIDRRQFCKYLGIATVAVAGSAVGGISLTSCTGDAAARTPRELIYQAATKYYPNLVEADLGKDLPDSSSRDTAKRGEILVMLSNAFGEFPEPKGNNARRGVEAPVEYADAPAWAAAAIANLNRAKLLVSPADGLLKPDEDITSKELDTYLRRIYSLYGTRLADDFYAAINKDWLDNAELVGLVAGGTEDLLAKTNGQINTIFDEILTGSWPDNTPERKIVDYYQSYLDKDAQARTGAAPLKPYLDMLASANDAQQLNAALAACTSGVAYSPLIKFHLSPDYQHGTKNAIYFTCAFDTTLAENLEESIGKTLELAGASNPADAAKLAADIQTRLVEAGKDIPDFFELEDEERLARNKRMTLAEIQALAPSADLNALLAATGLQPGEEYIIREDSEASLKVLGGFYTTENAAALAALAQYNLANEYKRYTGSLFAEPDAAAQSPEELEAEARNMTKRVFESYLSDLYGRRFSSPEIKANATDITKNFIEVYKTNIKKLSWMSEATKTAAVKKVENITLLIAYPDEPDTFTGGLEIGSINQGGSYLQNEIALIKRRMQQDAEAQGKPVSKNGWLAPSSAANAFANQNINAIGIPAGILQEPFYSPDAPAEENMAGIGWVVAHEITHLFDPIGSLYDEEGGFNNWWTAEDRAKFAERCQAVSDFYAGAEFAPGLATNSTTTVGEDVADLGGVACALEALKKLKPTPDYQRFFTHAAEIWRITGNRTTYESFASNNHSVGNIRVNQVFKTLPEFYEAFTVKEGDGMYVAPDKRVKVW